MADTGDTRREWIKRVLNINVPAAPSEGGRPDPNRLLERWRAARAGWQQAAEAVDSQINGLAGALRASGDTDLQQIADTGLMTVTGGFRTKMTAALMDIGDGDIEKLRRSGAKAAGFAEKLRDQVESDPRVIACDESDFGPPVKIRATLGPALAELAGLLRAAASA